MKKYIAVTLALVLCLSSLLPTFAMAENPYGCSDWAMKSVEDALRRDFLEEEKSYDYHKEITRGEFCGLIFKLVSLSMRFPDWFAENIGEGAETLPESIVNPFSDTQDVYVILLNAFGVINGKSETTFAPDERITREEVAVILTRALDLTVELDKTALWYEYADSAQVSDWAMSAVQSISNYGFMKGVGDNCFLPKATCTMEEAVVVVMRAYDACIPVWLVQYIEREMGEVGYVYENDTWNYVTYDMATGRRVYPIEVDAETFEIMENTEFAKDKDNVFHMSSKVKGADPATFEVIEESTGLFYAKDKKRVYVYTKGSSMLIPIAGADPETFEVLECPYAKDKKDAYNGCLPLYVDDVESFVVLEGYGGIHTSPSETFFTTVLYSEEVVEYNIEKYGFLDGPFLYSNGGRAKTDRMTFEGYRCIEEK